MQVLCVRMSRCYPEIVDETSDGQAHRPREVATSLLKTLSEPRPCATCDRGIPFNDCGAHTAGLFALWQGCERVPLGPPP